MRKSVKVVLVLLLALAGAGPRARAAEPAKKAPAVDVAGMDRAIAPGDDFYGYANGGWMKATVIPPDRAVYGSFTLIEEEVTRRTAELVQAAGKSKAAAGSPAVMVGDYYAAYMDEAAIEKRGLTPVQPELDAIAKIQDRAALARVLGSGLRADVDALNSTNFYTERPFGLWVGAGLRRPEPQRRLPDAGRARNAGPRQLPRHRREGRRAPVEVQGPRRERA